MLYNLHEIIILTPSSINPNVIVVLMHANASSHVQSRIVGVAVGVVRCATHDSSHLPTHMIHPMISMLSQVAKGCEYLHNKRIVHGDLKPDNVLLVIGTHHTQQNIIAKVSSSDGA